MPAENLTRVEAQERASNVRVLTYDIALDLCQGEKSFDSHTKVHFFATPGSQTFIDLVAADVEEIILNGLSLPLQTWQDSRIQLTDLSEENRLEVRAKCKYSNTGDGLHRFVDPADGQAYVYSQFEVADSRQVYACFEQPDMKATHTFTITAPSHWKMFSNARTPEPIAVQDGISRWEFGTAEQMSSYITAVVGGPFVGETSELVSIDGRTIPLGVYCRASLGEHLDAQNIIELTKIGFEYFEKHFDYAYPFSKYDQVFVPEFNAGAMENAGLVTYRDSYVFRSKPVEAQVERRCITILHELSHMWFGNLVTMQWWDDLWLNESFAEFMSTLATAEATEWTGAWTTFASLEKSWAYAQDQLISTHPIVADIRDLEDVEVNFDGITYAKGAAVLRQLVSYVGRDNFFVGLQEYFKKHQWSNTVLTDLLTQLELASGRDLATWSKVWLQESGMNTLRLKLGLDENQIISECAVIQECPYGVSLRPHRLVVSGYDLQEVDGRKQYGRTCRVELDISGAKTTLSEFLGTSRPDVILLNDEDLTYAKVRMDAKSLQHAATNIGAFPDSLSRTLVLSSAWDMTRDGEMPASAFIDLLMQALLVETESTGLMVLLRRLNTTLRYYLAPAHREQIAVQVSKRLIWLARLFPAGSDAQLQLVKAAALHAYDRETRDSIKGWYYGEEHLHGLNIDLDLRWDILTSLSAFGILGEAEILELEATDVTISGQQRAAAARAAMPFAAAKSEAWDLMFKRSSTPNGMIENLVSGFNLTKDPLLLVPYVDRYFDALLDIWANRGSAVAQDLVEGCYPLTLVGLAPQTGVDVIDLTRYWLDDNHDAPPALRRLVMECLDGAERALRVQQADVR